MPDRIQPPAPTCPECGHEWEWHQAAAGAGCTKVTRGSLDCPKEVCQCERVGPRGAGGGVGAVTPERIEEWVRNDPKAWAVYQHTRALDAAEINALRTRLADTERERDEARNEMAVWVNRYSDAATTCDWEGRRAEAFESERNTARAESDRLTAALRRVEEGVTVYLRDVEARIADPKTFPAARAEMQGEAFAYRRILGLYTVPPQEAPDAIR